ncbi:Lysosomal acid lipase/cholesteryl ester hydrolase [Halotydeus destructor]|nr:Lysosomal acid lipase/cholesteryl ester hydrolase [Halotydeus destructor]
MTSICFSIFCVLIIQIKVLTVHGQDVKKLIDPDTFRDTMALITSRGFLAEDHRVITEDNYVITMHRIVSPFPANSKRKPVLIVHGLMDTSADFVMNSPGGFALPDNVTKPDIPTNNLGFALANRGYDVWLGNVRGNIYSQAHVTLDTGSREYWNFTFDHMTKYDLPAFISHIQKHTNETNVGYIGHSQGTVIMFALLSSQPKYNEIIKPFVALAPVISILHFKTPLIKLADIPDAVGILLALGHSFPPKEYPPLNRIIVNLFCHGPNKLNCKNLLFLAVGFDSPQLDADRLRVYASHCPSPTSMKNLAHFVQNLKAKQFAMYDFGEKGNVETYGQVAPPLYDVRKITNKYVSLLYSSNDWDADPKDVAILKKSLKVPLFEDYLVPYKRWNHMDFVWGKESGLYINRKVIQILDRAIKSNNNEI